MWSGGSQTAITYTKVNNCSIYSCKQNWRLQIQVAKMSFFCQVTAKLLSSLLPRLEVQKIKSLGDCWYLHWRRRFSGPGQRGARAINWSRYHARTRVGRVGNVTRLCSLQTWQRLRNPRIRWQRKLRRKKERLTEKEATKRGNLELAFSC